MEREQVLRIFLEYPIVLLDPTRLEREIRALEREIRALAFDPNNWLFYGSGGRVIPGSCRASLPYDTCRVLIRILLG